MRTWKFIIAAIVASALLTPATATFYKWSKTAATNSSADSSINWAEGMSPSAVNDSARAMMAATAKYRDDISGSVTTGGTATAYTLTSNQVFSSLALMSGSKVCFTPNVTNGATVTIDVDGLGAKALRSAPSVELEAGVLVLGTPYCASYSNSNSEWIVEGSGGYPTYVPLGAMMDYTGATAPNARFVLPYGQAISRTTYANYFALVSTTYGVGDGSTTFNVPDLRGRVAAGKDNMGGSAASRLTSTYLGASAETLGAVGGLESTSITVAQANLPNVNFTVTGSVATATTSNYLTFTPSGGAVGSLPASGGTSTYGSSQASSTFSSGIAASGGSGTAITFANVPPTIVLNKILRIQ